MNFTFNGDNYLQTGGTAMGTGVAPNYANLFMDRFEANALNNWPDKPLVWLRIIDDIFLVWTHGENKLLEFIHYLNSIHPTIKFTQEYTPHRINFLDTMVKNTWTTPSSPPYMRNQQIHICIYTTHQHTITPVKPRVLIDNS